MNTKVKEVKVKEIIESPKIDIFDAIKKNNIEEVQKNELLLACAYGRTDVVEKLLKNENVEINQVDMDGKTSLYWACYKGYKEVVKALLKNKKINVNLADKEGKTPLYWAESCDRAEIVKDLLGRGATLYAMFT